MSQAIDNRAFPVASGKGRGQFFALLLIPLIVFIGFGTTAEGFGKAVIAAAILFPAIFFAAVRSTYLLDYFLVVVAFNREMRRLMDWMAGEYDSKPLTSITPMAISLLMLAVALSQFGRWPPAVKRGAGFIGLGLAYSMAIGGIKYKLGAVYGLMDYVMPLSVLLFAVSMRPSIAVSLRWIRTLVTLGVIVAIYGVVQWALVPSWDAAWIEWSGMWSSMGHPEPFKIGIASTLESRGPAAWFLANAAIFMIASPRFRRPYGMVGAIFVSGVLLLTTVRSSWGFVVLAILLLNVLNRGRSARQLVVLGVAVAAVAACIPLLPESQTFQTRVATLSSIHNDSSFQGRVGIAREGVMGVLRKPFGYGMGASGNGGRLVEGGTDGIGDNGYLSLLADLGVPGALLFAAGLFIIVRPISIHVWRNPGADFGTLALAMLGSSLVFLLIFNCLTSAHGGYLWIPLASAYGAFVGMRSWGVAVAPTGNVMSLRGMN